MERVLEIMEELYDDVQTMRENGETDLRSVLHFIDRATTEIEKELNK
jgi:hypothetical protein